MNDDNNRHSHSYEQLAAAVRASIESESKVWDELAVEVERMELALREDEEARIRREADRRREAEAPRLQEEELRRAEAEAEDARIQAVLESSRQDTARLLAFANGNIEVEPHEDAPLKLEDALCLPEIGGPYTRNPAFRAKSTSFSLT